MTFDITEARREAIPAVISIAGKSGSGKTYSSLLLARGLAGPDGKIVVIDTEGRRSLLYADDATINGFCHLDMRPPFSSERMREAVLASIESKAACIIIDSASHEHDGDGGMLDYAQKEGERLKTESFSKWIKPKMAHKQFLQAVLGAPCHMILTLRQHEVTIVDPKKQGGGKVGDKTISTVCDSQLVFEMTLAVILDDQCRAQYVKVPLPLQKAVRNGEVLTVDHGRLLAQEVCRGGERTSPDEAFSLFFPGGEARVVESLAAYKDLMKRTIARAQSTGKLPELQSLNSSYIRDVIAKSNDALASEIIDLMGAQE